VGPDLLDESIRRVRVDVGEGRFLLRRQGQHGRDGIALIALPGVGDQGGDSMLERGGGARREKPAEAPAEQRRPPWVDLSPGQGVVHHWRKHRFPIGPHRDALLVQGPSPSGTVEEQAVVAAPQGSGGMRKEYLLNVRIIAIGADQRGPGPARIVDLGEIRCGTHIRFVGAVMVFCGAIVAGAGKPAGQTRPGLIPLVDSAIARGCDRDAHFADPGAAVARSAGRTTAECFPYLVIAEKRALRRCRGCDRTPTGPSS